MGQSGGQPRELPVLAAHPRGRRDRPHRVPGPAHVHAGRSWGQPLGPDRAGSAKGRVIAIYNGRLHRGNPRDIPLTAHAQIQLDIGRPLVAPVKVTFADGL
jgi:hypothetical protein